jgi:hypothetical protein
MMDKMEAQSQHLRAALEEVAECHMELARLVELLTPFHPKAKAAALLLKRIGNAFDEMAR